MRHSSSHTDPPISGSTSSGGPNDDGRGGGGGRGAGGSNGGDSFHNDHSDHHNRLPEDLQLALAYGSLSPEALTRYFNALENPFLKLLMSIPAYRTRALADSSFLFKLLAQEVIGNGTALASEIAVHAEHLMDELEYVASDLIVDTVVEAAFVWSLAPKLSLPASASSSAS
ncbi:Protein RETICULATA-RELATED 5, chloroplastic [Gracilariopsis chorda]|uniref:Protein RETICULATA-RELATED 5, chloroplastic n=1 Tax=Gracilariopsis chorda TaxID=448386 RepID=A0A2V3IRK8_9FLOR|nr:Protein RETICULATA-RELATED 5, chloroplastic [Gracilariopsis chorda]|eukprot:PXF44761.1 Protein RETICULATA-RELATED 5, chloroplastic [Gracilariopsis chorda]